MVGDEAHVVRVRRGGNPRRKANGMVKEFGATVGPLDQPNPLAGGIRLFGTAWLVRQPDTVVSIPAVARYMYLRREQERRGFSDQPNVRGLRGRPAHDLAPTPPLFSLRMPPTPTPPTWKRAGSTPYFPYLVRPNIGMGKSRGKICLVDRMYGLPAGAGIASGAVWNRRDVLAAPILFSTLFSLWTWYSGPTESFTGFVEQMHGNAKMIRAPMSRGLIGIARWWGFLGMVDFVCLAVVGYWKAYHYFFGRKNIHNITVPVPAAEGTDQTTGTGADVASPLVLRRLAILRKTKNQPPTLVLLTVYRSGRPLRAIREPLMTSNRANPRM